MAIVASRYRRNSILLPRMKQYFQVKVIALGASRRPENAEKGKSQIIENTTNYTIKHRMKKQLQTRETNKPIILGGWRSYSILP